MPPSKFNRTAWPESGAHRDLLEHLDALHRRHGCRSLRGIGREMHLSYTRVYDVVRGTSLPVSEVQVRDLVLALVGRRDAESERTAADAADLYVKARRERDERPVESSPEGSVTAVPPGAALAAPDPVVDRVEPPHRLRRPTTLAALVATLLAGTAIAVWTLGAGRSDATPPAALQVTENFDGELDARTWVRPDRPDLVHVGGGTLHFTADAEDTADGVEARLAPRASGPFRRVAFTAAVPSYDRAGPGGVSLVLSEPSGRTHRVSFGPSAPGLEVAVLVCSQDHCAEYEDYDPPSHFVPFEVGEEVPIEVVLDGDRLRFTVREEVVAETPLDTALTAFSFDLYGAEEEAWHITVDSLRVSA